MFVVIAIGAVVVDVFANAVVAFVVIVAVDLMWAFVTLVAVVAVANSREKRKENGNKSNLVKCLNERQGRLQTNKHF